MTNEGGRSAIDEAFALLTPERILNDPRATGKGVRVAIVDSGVDVQTISARYPASEPISFFSVSNQTVTSLQTGKTSPSSPHGTIVADVILRLAPQTQLFSLDVFGSEGMNVESVVAAIRYAVSELKCHIVNLSLGISEKILQQLPKRNALYRAVEEAYYAGSTVVAAANNDHPFTLSYPAAFGLSLLSVDKQTFDDQPLTIRYEPREKIEFQAHSRAYLGPFSQEPATSWATPHISGIVAKLLSLDPHLKPFEIKAILYRLSQRFAGKV